MSLELTRVILDKEWTVYIHPANFFADENFRVNSQACFVIMPFSEPWSRTVYSQISSLLEMRGFHCRRADDYFDRVVLSDIWRQLNEATLVIVDLTGDNPNVYYELGIAHALGKETLSLIQAGGTLPFDQRAFRVLEYEYANGSAQGLDALLSWVDSLAYTSSPQVMLKRGLVSQFNEWRRVHRYIDLSNADLSDLNLQGVDFSSGVLRGALLLRTDLSRSNLAEVKLTSADLGEAILDESHGVRAQVSEANLVDASVVKANLSNSTIIRSDLRGLVASSCVLRGANLSESQLENSIFRGADLRDGIWLRVHLQGADFTGAQVSGMTVESATWRRYRNVFEAAEDASEMIVEGD